jgi:GntR family transcriptional regulator
MGQLPAFIFSPSSGRALYLQLLEQLQHAIETGVLEDGAALPGIRTLAETLALSHNTVAKAYTELEQQGWLELRHGSGAYVSVNRRVAARAARVRTAQVRMRDLIATLRGDGLSDDEIRRLCEAELRTDSSSARTR